MTSTATARFAIFGALWVALVSCSRPPQTLRVGANVWAGYGPLFLAQGLGHYDQPAIRVFSFPSAVDVMRAYRNRVIDVAALTADEALLLVQNDPDQRIILVCDYSNGADVILAKPAIRRLADLRGKTVAVESGALGAFVLARALQTTGLKADDIQVFSREIESMPSAYDREEIAAVVVFEPVASIIRAKGARQIFDSRQIPGEIVDVLVTRKSVIETQPAGLRSLVTGWFAAVEFLKARPTEANRLVAARARLPADTYPGALQTIELVGREANEQLLGGNPAGLTERLRQLQAVMVEHKLLTHATAVEQLPDARFVRGRKSGR